MSETATDKATDTAWSLFALVISPPLFVAGAAVEAWAVGCIWRMFISPEPPEYRVILGACMLVSLVAFQSVPEEKAKAPERLGRAIGWCYLRPPIFVGFAWLVKWALL